MKTLNQKLEKYLERKLQRRHNDISWKVTVKPGEQATASVLHITSLNGSFYFGDSKENVYLNYMVSDILKKKGIIAAPHNVGPDLPILNWGSTGAWLLTEDPEFSKLTADVNTKIECPHCDYENNDDEEFCRQCESDLHPEKKLVAEHICHNCETGIPEEAVICLYCGAHQFSFLKLA